MNYMMKVLGDALIVERRGVNIVVPLLLFVEKGEVYMIIYLGRHLLVMVKLQEGNKLDYPTNPWLLKAEEKKSMN